MVGTKEVSTDTFETVFRFWLLLGNSEVPNCVNDRELAEILNFPSHSLVYLFLKIK